MPNGNFDPTWKRLSSLSLVAMIAAVFAGCDVTPEKRVVARGEPIPASAPLPLLEYAVQIERDGEIVSTPRVILPEGERATIEIGDREKEGDVYSVTIEGDVVYVAAILRDGFDEIACPHWVVTPGEIAEMSIEGETLRSSFAVSATVVRF